MDRDKPANTNTSQHPSSRHVYNPLEALRPGESLICEIKRHPIGLLIPYAMAALVIVGALLAVMLVPYYAPDITEHNKLGTVLGALLAVVAAFLYVYIATLVYTGNRWIVTSDSITQVTQAGLFNIHSSQLSLDDLEDMTVGQNGILQLLLGYGSLCAETAGERSKFHIAYCPDPNAYARKILTARETYLAGKEHPKTVM